MTWPVQGMRMRPNQVKIDDSESLKRTWEHRDTGSGHPKFKHFCSRCGTQIMTEVMYQGGKMFAVRAPIFKDDL